MEQPDPHYKAISVCPSGGTTLYVGVLPAALANSTYQQLSLCPGLVLNMIDVPAEHDLLITQVGGDGFLSSPQEGAQNGSGVAPTNFVQMGTVYQFEDPAYIPFLIDRASSMFVQLDDSGITQTVDPADLIQMYQ